MILSRYGENGIRIVFGQSINPEVHEKVRQCFLYLRERRLPYISEIIPAFCACLVEMDDSRVNLDEFADFLQEHEDDILAIPLPEPVIHDIPVRYGGQYGPDLDFVSAHTGLSPDDIIDIHTETPYTVYTVGFIPGFPYLGTLDRRLYVPRLKTPRIKVPAGSVGIALNQTGIYPFESPGGWQLIGQTEEKLFNKETEPFCLMKMGDRVRFRKR